MKFKKFIKILSVNILLFIFLFCVLEIITISCLCNLWKHVDKNLLNEKWSYFFRYKSKILEDENWFRPVEYRQGKKLPVVLFGCSLTHGIGLKDNETFSRKLADYTNRTVYNKGFPAGGAATMLHYLQTPEFKKEIPEAEYFIYTFFYDHLRRVYMIAPDWFNEYFIVSYYISSENKLKENHFNKLECLIFSTATYRLMNYLYVKRKSEIATKKNEYTLFFRIVEESNKIIKRYYPDAKFVILVYDNEKNFYSLYPDAEEKLFNEFGKRNDIKVLYTKKMSIGEDILNGKYRNSDKLHPSTEVWDILVPEISKELNL